MEKEPEPSLTEEDKEADEHQASGTMEHVPKDKKADTQVLAAADEEVMLRTIRDMQLFVDADGQRAAPAHGRGES